MGRALSGRRRQAAALLAVVVVALSAPSPATAVGPGPVSSGLRSAGSEATGATREDGTIKGLGPAPAEAGANTIVGDVPTTATPDIVDGQVKIGRAHV